MLREKYSYSTLRKNGDFLKGNVVSCNNCKTKPFLERSESAYSKKYRYKFICPSCGKHTATQSTAQEAKTIWNKRQKTGRVSKFIEHYFGYIVIFGFQILASVLTLLDYLSKHK